MTTGAPAADAEGREGGSPEEPRGFSGRGGWHLVALLAALGLILAMSLDWYTTQQGEEFRRVEDAAEGATRNVDPNLDEDAAHAAEGQEATAWQADAFVDRLILIACLTAFLAAVAAALMRSLGRRPEPPRNPAAIATVAGLAGTVLILYRMFQPPGLNEAAILKLGAPLGLVSVGLLTIGARLATIVEQEERAEARGELPAAEARRQERARRREERAGAAADERARRRDESGSRRGLRRRRTGGGDGAEAGGAPAAAAGRGSADEIDFDFPAPAPPGPTHAGEPVPPGPALPVPPAFPEPPEPDRAPGSLWRPEPQRPAGGAPPEETPPVDARPVGAPNPEEAPDWDAGRPAPREDTPVEDNVVEEPPVADPPVGEPPVGEPPVGEPEEPRDPRDPL